MLKRLDISNFALIENVNLSLEKGFTSITGETGAGKSILLKALNLLMGERADTSVLKQSEKKCVLEAEFDVSKLDLQSFFDENELDFDPNCIIRREFNASGKSRAFINDTPVQIAQLKALGEQLISIHTQHQTLEILRPDFQLDVLDHFAGIQIEVKNYRSLYKSYREKVNQLIELQVKDKESRKEKDYLTFLLTELETANLGSTNFEDLKLKAEKIENFEKIQTAIRFGKSVLENDSFSPSIGLKTLIETFDEIKPFDPSFAAISARLLSLKIELDDIAGEIDDHDDEFGFSEEDATLIREKIEQFNALLFKHNLKEASELIDLQESLQHDLDAISTLESSIEQLDLEINALKKEVDTTATKIRKKRLAAIPELTKAVGQKLKQLAMPNAELEITLSEKEKPGTDGIDSIDFMFKTNLGGQFASLKKVASGGELSRLMLVVLSILSEKKNLPTLIFDEIDTGVSGEVATKIANEFDHMGEQIQVIAITHLPQVAGKGKTHFHVSKKSTSTKTSTYVNEVANEARIEILAGMMSGEKITEAAKENAANLLSNQ